MVIEKTKLRNLADLNIDTVRFIFHCCYFDVGQLRVIDAKDLQLTAVEN